MKRVQIKRTKGWRLPENTVCVNRPTKYGNPMKLIGDSIYIDASYRRKVLDKWVFLQFGDIDDILHLYLHVIKGFNFFNEDLQHWSDVFKTINFEVLRGKNLACFCSLDKKCHADVLIKLLNTK